MPTILCLDDFTCGLAEAAHVLRENGCRVLAADDNSGAVQVAVPRPTSMLSFLTATASGTMPGL